MQKFNSVYSSAVYSENFNNDSIALIDIKAKSKLVFLATGGTGGHIFPALALKEVLESHGFKVRVLADAKFAKYHPFDQEHLLIPAANFANKSPIKIIASLLTLAKGFIKALCYVVKESPDLIIGFGGYATYPTMLAAIISGKKVILHEANSVVGKVNRLLLWKAKYLATGFQSIKGVAAKYRDKVIYTGNPVRSEITASPLKIQEGRLSILIIGGSQGAKVFSSIIPEVILNLPKEMQKKLFICQQVREEDVESIKNKYAQAGIAGEIQSFFNDMNEKLAQADLVIARAGASTIAELIEVGRPAIFIPYPSAADNHQYYNAKAIVDLGAGWLVPESKDSSAQISEIIKSIDKDPSVLIAYAAKLKEMDQDASENIVKLLY